MDNNYFGNICYCRKCNGIIHTIKKGDSLYLLSRYYNVPIGEIMNANRQLNVYNLQIGEEICIPIRRSDMMNDNINGSMNNGMMNNNMRNSNMNNNNMNNTNNSAMPDMQASEEEQGAGNAGSMEYTSVETASAASESFDKSIKMSELINQEDMTFEKFLSLIQN